MNHPGRTTQVSAIMLAAALWLLTGEHDPNTGAQVASGLPGGRGSSRSEISGTTINVALGGRISSETARAGDAWHGTVTENVTTLDGRLIPAGTQVEGVVSGAIPARRDSRAFLELGVRSIRVGGRREPIAAAAEPVFAGSPHARDLGAVAVAGATLGGAGATESDGRAAAFGGPTGGAAVAARAGAPGDQVVLSEGTVMSFAVGPTVAMR